MPDKHRRKGGRKHRRRNGSADQRQDDREPGLQQPETATREGESSSSLHEQTPPRVAPASPSQSTGQALAKNVPGPDNLKLPPTVISAEDSALGPGVADGKRPSESTGGDTHRPAATQGGAVKPDDPSPDVEATSGPAYASTFPGSAAGSKDDAETSPEKKQSRLERFGKKMNKVAKGKVESFTTFGTSTGERSSPTSEDESGGKNRN